MKKLLTAILLLFMSSTLFAQGRKSLITPQMAKRTAYLVSYTIEIDKEGKMRVKPTDILLDKAQFELESPSLYEFANLKKEVFVPSNYTLKLIEKRKLAFSEKEIKVEWSKNENSWVLSKPKDVEKELGSDTYYAVRYGLLAHLNNMKELQGDKKKHTVLGFRLLFHQWLQRDLPLAARHQGHQDHRLVLSAAVRAVHCQPRQSRHVFCSRFHT